MGGRIRPRFALASSQAYGLRWGIKGNDFQRLGFSAENPLSRAFARVRKKGNVRCRLLQAARAFALPAALSHHLAYDHQMTPPLFAGAFRAFGPCAPLTSARLSGIASRALRPKASRLSGLENELFFFEKDVACLAGELRAGALACDLGERRSQETHGAKLNVPSPQSGAV